MIEYLSEDLDYVNLFFNGQNAYAQSGIGSCALEALGVNAVIKGFSGGIKKLGKKGVLKIIRKVALRTLGWVGAIVAAVDFADCMGWFGNEGSSSEEDNGTQNHA